MRDAVVLFSGVIALKTLAKIFVDGQEGTTGLRIHDYLAARTDVEVLKIDSDKRKDPRSAAPPERRRYRLSLPARRRLA